METRIILLEDEALTAKRTRELVVECDPTAKVMATIPSVSGAVQWLSKNPAPDLFLMDVHLEDDLVFDLFNRIEINTPVIFITAYDEYVVKAFKVNSIDYLLKPVDVDDLIQAVKKVKERLSSRNNSYQYQSVLNNIQAKSGKLEKLAIPSANGIDFFNTGDIIYCSADGSCTTILLKG